MNSRIEKSLKWRFKMRKLGASHICKKCGRPVFPTPEHIVDALGAHDYEPGMVDNQFTIIWNEEGWRGGINGGIRRSCDGKGWENF